MKGICVLNNTYFLMVMFMTFKELIINYLVTKIREENEQSTAIRFE